MQGFLAFSVSKSAIVCLKSSCGKCKTLIELIKALLSGHIALNHRSCEHTCCSHFIYTR